LAPSVPPFAIPFSQRLPQEASRRFDVESVK
jgi:hypothetical protein